MKKRKVSICAMIALFIFLSVMNANSQTVWFSILSTETEIDTAVAKLKALSIKDERLELVSCDDCSNLRSGLILVTTGIRKNENEAEKDIIKWRKRGIKDAYLKSCNILPGSRLALGVPLLDQSIYKRPVNIVNWGYEDAMSNVQPIDNGYVAIVWPQYEEAPEDVMEGLKIKIGIIRPNRDAKIDFLAENCIDPEFSVNSHLNLVAVSCVNETAADNLLHKTIVYQMPSKKKIFEQSRCKNPKISDKTIVCEKESLDKNGEMHIESKKYDFQRFEN